MNNEHLQHCCLQIEFYFSQFLVILVLEVETQWYDIGDSTDGIAFSAFLTFDYNTRLLIIVG